MAEYALNTRKAPWAIAAAAFTNPMYISAPLGQTDNSQSTGFDISSAAAVTISFEGTYTGATVTHQQTLDADGVAGWFDVLGVPNDGGSATETGSTAGEAYTFATTGVRHRMVLSALSTGTIVTRVLLDGDGAVTTSSGGGGGGGDVNLTEIDGNAVDVGTGASGTGTLRVAISSDSVVSASTEALVNTAAPSYGDGDTEPLSMDEQGGLRTIIQDSTGAPIDWDDPVPVLGEDSNGATADPNPVIIGGRDSGGVVRTAGVTTGGILQVAQSGSWTGTATGQTADDAAATGNPVQVAGKYTATAPTFADGDTAQLRLTTKGNLIVGGQTADDAAAPAAADTYPAVVGGIYRATLPTYTDGDRTQTHYSARGELLVGGPVADDAAALGNPVPVGGIFNSTRPTYTTGDRTQVQTDANGSMIVSIAGGSATTVVNTAVGGDGTSNSLRMLWVNSNGGIFNGTSWDRSRSIAASFGSATGVQAVEQAGASFAYISGAATTQVKSGAGILHKIVVNTSVAAATISVIDNTSGSTVNIALITLTAIEPHELTYDLSFATGLRIITSGATDITVVYR